MSSGRVRWLVAGVAATALLGAGSACDSRAREIRAGLSPDQRALYDAGAAAAGECWTCHDLYTRQNKIGPSLLGVFGRPAASVEGFAYSNALRGSGIVWNRDSIAAYVANPQATVPGTSMVWRGVGDPDVLAAIVFYLEQSTRPGGG